MAQLPRFLERDSVITGVLLAVAITAIFLFTLFGLSILFPDVFASRFLRRQVLILVSIFVNLLPFRYYMVSKKLDQTGRGMLFSMFAMMVVYFVFFHQD